MLIWVPHHGGLKFKQGKSTHAAAAGQWFIFDGRIGHAVRGGKRTTRACVRVGAIARTVGK